MLTAILALQLVGADVRLVLFIDDQAPGAAHSHQTATEAQNLGAHVLVGHLSRGNNRAWTQHHGITRFPCWIGYIGHHASAPVYRDLKPAVLWDWHQALVALDRQRQTAFPSPAPWQAALPAEDRLHLRYHCKPGSCGMLGCAAHGGGVFTLAP